MMLSPKPTKPEWNLKTKEREEAEEGEEETEGEIEEEEEREEEKEEVLPEEKVRVYKENKKSNEYTQNICVNFLNQKK